MLMSLLRVLEVFSCYESEFECGCFSFSLFGASMSMVVPPGSVLEVYGLLAFSFFYLFCGVRVFL